MLKLLTKLSDVNVKDSMGRTAVHYACTTGNAECLRALIEAGASVQDPEKDPSKRYQYSPLQITLAGGHIELIKPLVAAGAEIDDRDDQYVVEPYVLRALSVYSKYFFVLTIIREVVDEFFSL